MERIKKSSRKSEIRTDRECSSEEPVVKDKLLQDFSSYTTLHGLHFLFDSHSVIRRLIWILLLVLCFIALAFQFNVNWNKLRSNLSVIGREVEKSDSLVFPAVSICNQNMMKKSRINGTDAQAYLDRMDLKASLGIKIGNVSSAFDVEKAVLENGHNVSDMIKGCVWRGRRCGSQNFTMFFSFLRGLCYTFNSGKEGHPLLNVTSHGKDHGLTLYLDAEPEEYYGPFSYATTGFKVLTHDQNEYPNMEDEAQDISPGFSTNLRISRTKIISLRSPFSSACDERNLATFQKYSRSACLMECYTNLTIKTCGCRGLSMSGGVNQTGYCIKKKMNDCLLLSFDKQNPSRCDCPDPCVQVQYNTRISLGYFPSSSLWDTLHQMYESARQGNRTAKRIDFTRENIRMNLRKRMAHVTIFYKTLASDVIRERPAFDISDFVSDMGGNMGLFLGCSLLTLCEFIDLIFIGILTCWRRSTRQSSRVDQPCTEMIVQH